MDLRQESDRVVHATPQPLEQQFRNQVCLDYRLNGCVFDGSGFRLDVTSDQLATQVFTAYWLGIAGIPRKVVHGGPDLNYTTSGAVAIEQQR